MPWIVAALVVLLLIVFFVINAVVIRRDMNTRFNEVQARLESDANAVVDVILEKYDAPVGSPANSRTTTSTTGTRDTHGGSEG